MVASANDIGFYLSGGLGNTNPYLSLGGEPSRYPLLAGINNLFESIDEDTLDGVFTDYRCIYVFNNHASDPITNVIATLTSTSGGCTVTMGVPIATDVQTVTITNGVSGGSYTLVYDPLDPDIVVNYDADIAVWATNLQTALNAIPSVSGAVVTSNYYAGPPIRYVFTIRFEGVDDHKQHPTLVVKANNLIPVSTSVTIVAAKLVNGGPINNIAPSIAYDTVPPTGITFVNTAINVGTLASGDGFPIWIRRSIAPNTTTVFDDGFDLRIDGEV